MGKHGGLHYTFVSVLYGIFLILLAIHPAVYAKQKNLKPWLVSVELNKHRLERIYLCYQDQDGHVWLPEKELQELRLRLPKQTPYVHHEQKLYNLARYPLQYQLDPYTLRLTIDAPGSLLPLQIMHRQREWVPALRPKHWGGFFNYDLFALHRKHDQFSALFDFGLFNPYGAGHSNFLVYKNFRFPWAGQDLSQRLIRLDTQWVLDQPEKISSWRFGDSMTSGIFFNGATRFAGIQYATNFSTQPNLITFPLPAFRGEANVPSTINVLVNNVSNQRAFTPGGPYVFDEIPAVTGAGTVNVVTQDLLGRSQVISFPYYASDQLLKQGLSNFSYEAGLIRRNYGISSIDYGRLLAVATYQRGITNRLTLGTHAELLARQQTIGFSADYLVEHYGVLAAGLSGAHQHRGNGVLCALGFTHQDSVFTYGVKGLWSSAHYLQIGDASFGRRPNWLSQTWAGYSNRFGMFGASYTAVNHGVWVDTNYSSLPHARLLTLSYNQTFLKSVLFTFGLVHDFSHARNTQAYLSFILPLDLDHSVSNFTSLQHHDWNNLTQLTKSLPTGVGYGYNIFANTQRNRIVGGDLILQNNIGTYHGFIAAGHDTSYALDARGGLVYLDRPFLARKIDKSFAVVRVRETPNINILYQNNSAGYTNRHGYLLIPDLLPYQENPIEVDATSLPLNIAFDDLKQTAMPYVQSGILVDFPVRRVQGVLIKLVRDDGDVVPAGATVMIDQQPYTVGYDGELYLIQAPDLLQGMVTWENHRCRFSKTLPESYEPIIYLGQIVCR
jgi:outer membrane usher protein